MHEPVGFLSGIRRLDAAVDAVSEGTEGESLPAFAAEDGEAGPIRIHTERGTAAAVAVAATTAAAVAGALAAAGGGGAAHAVVDGVVAAAAVVVVMLALIAALVVTLVIVMMIAVMTPAICPWTRKTCQGR